MVTESELGEFACIQRGGKWDDVEKKPTHGPVVLRMEPKYMYVDMCDHPASSSSSSTTLVSSASLKSYSIVSPSAGSL